jgi:hypothetical protein
MELRVLRTFLRTFVLFGVCGVLITGCGSASSSPGGSVVRVTERDFQITGPKQVPAGTVVFRVRNDGPDDHEFIVVRLGPSPIPLRADGMTVNEEALKSSTVGALEPGPPGSVRTVAIDLVPGRYEMFCNMEGHFMGGMHQVFVAVS